MAAADGIEHIVATPHANDRYAYDRPSLLSSLDHLRELIGHKPQLSLGCDFHLSYENMKAVLAHPHDFTIQGTNYLLVELSNFSIPPQVDEFFTQLNTAKLTPILTHPERNPIVQQNASRVLKWIEQGSVVQVTASALTGGWGERAWRTAQWLLEREAVHVLSTDAHDTKHRPPILSAGRQEAEEICGPGVAKALVDDNPRAIVCGSKLPYFPEPVMK